jgi:Zn-dependent peptidase ImmA (M78 family)
MRWEDVTQALKHWRETFENNGIFVFKDAFNYDMISGFCLYSREFPIIYLNNSMPKTRQIFTLFHELAHLIFGIGGIDTLDDSFIGSLSPNDKQIEIFCNEFAGKFLVPDDHFDSQIYGCKINDEVISSLAERYSVNREVILRKLLDRNIIDRRLYQEKAKEWIEIAKESKRGGGGGNYYKTKISYLGNQYLNRVLEKYYTKKIDVHQVSDYLDIKINKIPTLEAYYMSG